MLDIISFFSQRFDLFLIVVAAVSLLVGSFLNVVIYRLPRIIQNEWSKECREYLGLNPLHTDDESLGLCLPFSHCRYCKKTLKPWHNIPLISYFVLRGKCAYCYAKISALYPMVEFLCCMASVAIAWHFGVSWQTVAGIIFTWFLITLTFIDIDCQLLPDQLTLLMLWIGLFFSLFSIFIDSHDAIIGAMAGYAVFALTQWIFKLVTHKNGIGNGDFKFLAALGAFLGWQMLPLIILLASVCGIIFGLTHMLIKHQYKSAPMPFGPYLAIAGWIGLIWGHDILRIYLHSVSF
jgi:leader peptidase (prepilin peptidase)/N-methyltransferase